LEPENIIDLRVEQLREQIGDEKVLLGFLVVLIHLLLLHCCIKRLAIS
jgi:hypothetical protein